MHHPSEFVFTTVQTDLAAVPPKMKRFFLGIFVYFIAWGVLDAFFPVYLNTLVGGDYFLTGALYALFFLSGFLLFVPVGDLADKVKETLFISRVLALYPFIGLLYFAAGVFQGALGMAAFVLARLAHSATSSWRVVMESFIRVNTPRGHASEMFGLYFTARYASQVLGAVAGVAAVLFFSLQATDLHLFFLVLVPLALAAALVIRSVPSKGGPLARGIREVVLKDKIYAREVRDFKRLGYAGRVVVVLAFGTAFLSSLLWVFLPLLAKSLDFSLAEIGLVFVLTVSPFAFSFLTAELADHLGKLNVVAGGFVAAALLLGWLALYTPSGPALYLATLLLGFSLASIRPALHGVLTDIAPRVHDGEMTGIYRAVMRSSKLVSTVAIGALAQALGITAPFLAAALLSAAMALAALASRASLAPREHRPPSVEGFFS